MDDEILAITLYCIVDDWYKSEGQKLVRSRPGPKPKCTDSEIITIVLLHLFLKPGKSQRAFLRWLRWNHSDWFTHLPEDGNFNRRARSLLGLLSAFFQHLVSNVNTSPALLDTSSLEVVKLARATKRKTFRDDEEFGAARSFKVTTKGVFYGYKIVLLCDDKGLPFKIGLVPADKKDSEIAEWFLDGEEPGWRLADKAFWNKEIVEELKAKGQFLLIPPKRNSKRKWPASFWKLVGRIRRRIETTLSVLKEYFLLEHHRARTFKGLALRVLATVIAFVLWRQYALVI